VRIVSARLVKEKALIKFLKKNPSSDSVSQRQVASGGVRWRQVLSADVCDKVNTLTVYFY
jgi:hypothetical protein